VTRDVPANCIAAGNPAVIIKSWDGQTASWVSARGH
jgi:acetyltransferase-like isoleucine patch superfamily enzyme